MRRHPLGTRARVLLTSAFGPYAQDDRFGSRTINPMELYHNQVTREQGPFSLRMFHRSWGIMLIQHNISAPSTVLDFPTRQRFVRELVRHRYDVVGISAIIVNLAKVREMCRLVRQYSPHSTIVVGGHVTAVPGIERMIDADHIVNGDGIAWFREYLGEPVDAPIEHPPFRSAFGFRLMGLHPLLGDTNPAATIVPSVGCPLGCNFCTTSSFFGGKGKSTTFFQSGRELFEVMRHVEAQLGVSSFFMMDENFLLNRTRALELLDHMKRAGSAWTLYVFASANAVSRYEIQQLVDLGVTWIWMGLESAGSSYAKLAGTDTRRLVASLQSHGIRVLGSTIIGLEHHSPENIDQEIEDAIAHDTDFHQFMLYTPVPGTPLYREMQSQGRLLEAVDLADIHGQYKFNFKHEAISRDQSKTYLDGAFQRDFERNGPSLYRLIRTTFRGWQRYRHHADPRVRARLARDERQLRYGYGAALWAMETFLRRVNRPISERIGDLRREIESEFGRSERAFNAVVGRVLLWSSRRDARRHPSGRRIEPRTFVERRNWHSGQLPIPSMAAEPDMPLAAAGS